MCMYKELGQYLRDARNKKGYSIKEVGKELDLNYTYVSKMELGHKKPSNEVLAQLAQLYEVDLMELIRLSGVDMTSPMFEIQRDNPSGVDVLYRATTDLKGEKLEQFNEYMVQVKTAIENGMGPEEIAALFMDLARKEKVNGDEEK